MTAATQDLISAFFRMRIISNLKENSSRTPPFRGIFADDPLRLHDALRGVDPSCCAKCDEKRCAVRKRRQAKR